MSNIEQFPEEDLAPETESQGDIKPLRDKLEARCVAAKIPIEEVEGLEPGERVFRVGIPCGRERRWISCFNFSSFERLLSVPFEDYVFLQGLDAVCNYKTGTVEAAVRALGASSSRSLLSRLLKVPPGVSADHNAATGLELLSPDQKTSLAISEPSAELSKLVRGPSPRLSISLTADGITQHDKALEHLRRVSDALFFQIDLLHDVTFTLVRERRSLARRRRSTRAEQPPDIAFPVHEYDSAPISLYWYARSAIGMPLLQYLAYYQVIEYYFPTYSQADARRKLKAVLKDPGFRGDRDADLGRLLSAIHVSRSGAFGDERSQLRATLLECIDAEAVRQFITADSVRSDFLSSKVRGLCDHKIPIASPTADLRADVAERIYEIRCKIVHTKTDAKNSEFELLLPFSKEAEQLAHDIELVQFVAQQVLIAASTPFHA
ncbi:MAG: hypothetical protein KAF64_14220 [Hydrogenophaga sp.]|uniref:hypothetical protein n=1 Tax=Hydrogenophaga sp. TaxID=1904254 RepID=UPI0025C6F393|nr:hypothetical protein [Hydrogenophaga sp.]MBU7574508.1 hypothetical protein [Hydrogenophaga sp.]